MHFSVCLFIKQPHSLKHYSSTKCTWIPPSVLAAHFFPPVLSAHSFHLLSSGRKNINRTKNIETCWFDTGFWLFPHPLLCTQRPSSSYWKEAKCAFNCVCHNLIPGPKKKMSTSGIWTHALHIKWFEIKSTTRVRYFTAHSSLCLNSFSLSFPLFLAFHFGFCHQPWWNSLGT